MRLKQCKTIATYTFYEAVRSKLFWLLICMLIITVGLVEFTGSIAITEGREIRSVFFGSLGRLLAVFLLCLFVISSLLREINDKGLELFLAMPVSRGVYFFGKLTGYTLLSICITSLVGICLMLFAPFSQVLIWMVSLFCELLLMTAACIVCVFTLSQIPAALSAVMGFYLLGRSIGAFQLMGHGPLIDPNAWSQKFISGFIDFLAYLLPDFYRFTQSAWLIHSSTQWSDLQPIVGQTLIYLSLLSAIGLFDLYRKNL